MVNWTEKEAVNELGDLLEKKDYNLFFNWCDEHPNIHLTHGMCDDFGCADNCLDFKTLYEVLEHLRR